MFMSPKLKPGVLFFVFFSGLFPEASTLKAQSGTMATSSLTPSLQEEFSKTALPILKQSCFACHGPQPQDTSTLPPDLKRKADKTITKAQTEMGMDAAFPFPNGDIPKEDLKDIIKALQKDWMPPAAQKALNLGRPLSDSDRKVLLDWAFRTLKQMK